MPKTIKLLVLTLLSAAFLILSPNLFKAMAADVTPPVTTYVQTPDTPDGNNGWYVSIVRFDLTSTDLESGVKEINYKVDSNPWQTTTFTGSLNLAPDPSFEEQNNSWAPDPDTSFVYDMTNYAPDFATTSAKIVSAGVGWHGINNRDVFSAASSYINMTSSVYLKTENAAGPASYKVYAISQNALGEQTVTQVAESGAITGTTDWTNISLNFVVNAENVIGVYLDIGLDGIGTLWVDAVGISASSLSATESFTVGTDSSNHVVSFYAVDAAENSETITSVNFKQDTTPPGNWNDSGAFRGLGGPSDHHLYVYTNVQDDTSGLSTLTDKYKIHALEPGFGSYEDIMHCSSTWEPDEWTNLISPPFIPGVNSAYLLTPKTDFCNSEWKICKTVRFYSEDMAGNSASKDFCINGPWIRKWLFTAQLHHRHVIRGSGDNTDGLIETGDNTLTSSLPQKTGRYATHQYLHIIPTKISWVWLLTLHQLLTATLWHPAENTS
jgi:hypothetical protein